jgi:FMN phosphatase YigB (HAD superfamily)
MRLKSVFIDAGETLIGFRPRSYETILAILRDYGYKISTVTLFRAIAKTISKYNFPNELGTNPLNVSDLLFELGIYPHKELIKMLANRDFYGGEYFIYDDAIDFLEFIKSQSLRSVIVSNATKRMDKILKEFELPKKVDGIVESFAVGVVKPNPKIFYYASRIGNVPAIHIGDIYEVDILGARRAGINAILLDRFRFYEDINCNKAITLKDVTKFIEKIQD